MSEQAKKKRIVIEITDYCEEPFADHDLAHMKDEMEDMLADYDLEITGVKVENADDPR